MIRKLWRWASFRYVGTHVRTVPISVGGKCKGERKGHIVSPDWGGSPDFCLMCAEFVVDGIHCVDCHSAARVLYEARCLDCHSAIYAQPGTTSQRVQQARPACTMDACYCNLPKASQPVLPQFEKTQYVINEGPW